MPSDLTSEVPSLAEAARQIRSKRLSPVELTRSCLDRIAALDGALHCFIRLDEKGAMASARAAEQEIARGGYRGPLHGIPTGFKDLFNRRGMVTTAHSRSRIDAVAFADADVVTRLDAAGAIDLGKLAMHELALGGPSFDLPWPPVRNPWDVSRFTHGSSSGTAAAIAAGFILAGPGTDTAGSIRGPAAYCGIAGLKPTFGLVSVAGTVPLSPTLDHAGPMGWTVEDCAILLSALIDQGGSEPSAHLSSLQDGVKGLRIGVVRHFYETDHPVSAETREAIEAALDVYRALGAYVEEIRLAPLADYAAAAGVIMVCEAYQAHLGTLRENPQLFGRIFRNRISLGALYHSDDLSRAYAARARLKAAFADQTAGFDAIVTAVVPSTAPLIDEVPMWPTVEKPSLLSPFNITEGPALAVCCGFSKNGMPLSMQVAGRRFDDALILRIGHAYERAVGWRGKRPPARSTAKALAGNEDAIGVTGDR